MTMNRWGIMFLQETRLNMSCKREWEELLPSCRWQGTGYFSANIRPTPRSQRKAKDNTKSGGVAILISQQALQADVLVEKGEVQIVIVIIPASSAFI